MKYITSAENAADILTKSKRNAADILRERKRNRLKLEKFQKSELISK